MSDAILVLGAAFVDVIMDVPGMPVSGGDITARLGSTAIGGCAYNVFGALADQGAEATLFTPVGAGPYADIVRRAFAARGYAIEIEDGRADSGWDLCLVEPGGERSFITVQGIEQHWCSAWFDRLDLELYRYFYLSGYEAEEPRSTLEILRALRARRHDACLVFDASPRVRHIRPEILCQLLVPGTLIHCNEDEIGALTAETGPEAQMRDLYAKTSTPVVVTLGARGARVLDDRGMRIIPAADVEVVNSIGAGDTHSGGMLAGLQRGLDIDEAVALGNRLSALVVQRQEGSL